jgi:hypothetical protein
MKCKCISECRDLDKSVKCSLWYDETLAVYAIIENKIVPIQFTKDEQEAWRIYKATMLHGTNGMGIEQDRQSGIPISLKR